MADEFEGRPVVFAGELEQLRALDTVTLRRVLEVKVMSPGALMTDVDEDAE